jgi:hypothetical protein
LHQSCGESRYSGKKVLLYTTLRQSGSREGRLGGG